jgi:hypothetical protein
MTVRRPALYRPVPEALGDQVERLGGPVGGDDLLGLGVDLEFGQRGCNCCRKRQVALRMAVVEEGGAAVAAQCAQAGLTSPSSSQSGGSTPPPGMSRGGRRLNMLRSSQTTSSRTGRRVGPGARRWQAPCAGLALAHEEARPSPRLQVTACDQPVVGLDDGEPRHPVFVENRRIEGMRDPGRITRSSIRARVPGDDLFDQRHIAGMGQERAARPFGFRYRHCHGHSLRPLSYLDPTLYRYCIDRLD